MSYDIAVLAEDLVRVLARRKQPDCVNIGERRPLTRDALFSCNARLSTLRRLTNPNTNQSHLAFNSKEGIEAMTLDTLKHVRAMQETAMALERKPAPMGAIHTIAVALLTQSFAG